MVTYVFCIGVKSYSILDLNCLQCCIGCHLGRDKTMEKVRSRFFWRDMNADIREFVQCCDKCQRMNPKFNKAAATLHPIPVKAQVWN